MENKCPNCGMNNPQDSKFCKECAAPLSPQKISVTETVEAPAEELTTGSTFAGRYQIIEELGKGGMGRVYKVLDKEVYSKVALKLIKPEIAADKKTIERFRNELKTARDITHKNVCRMYDLNKEKGNYYITMEFVEGQDLKALIRQTGKLAVSTTLSIAKQICEGLSEAHRLGVVHRDLKPNNIMIDKDGKAKIMDFGIARSASGKGITGHGMMIGTPEYMSPEQVEAKDIDRRSDIYSLGIILYEMLTGRLPFEADTPFATGLKQKGEKPTDPKEWNPQIPADLNRLILRCLEKEKEKRYQTAEEIKLQLEKIEQGLPTTDRVIPQKKPRTSRQVTVSFNLWKFLLPALVVTAVVIIGLMIWSPWRQRTVETVSSNKPSIAVMYFENNTGDSSLDHWRKALSDLLITDLSQSRHLRVLSGEELFHVLKEMNRENAATFSFADLEGVASKSKVEHVIVGKLLKAGKTFRIDIQIQRPQSRETLASERVEGVGEKSLFSMVDDLTRKVKAAFDFSKTAIADDIDKNVMNITTDSPEALKYYVESGKLFDAGKYRESIVLTEKAVALDPEFATAYRSLAIAWENLGYSTEAKKYALKAFEYRHKTSERERLRIEAQHYRMSSESDWDKAIAAYRELLAIYPDEHGARTNLVVTLYTLERYDEAWKELEKHTEKESFYRDFWKAELLMVRNEHNEAARVLNNYLDSVSDHPLIRFSLSGLYLSQRKYDLALKEIDRTLAMSPADPSFLSFKGDLFLCQGEYEKAEDVFLKLMDTEEKIGSVWGHQCLGTLRLYEGKFEDSVEHYRKAGDSALKINDEDEYTVSRLFRVYPLLRRGDTKEALKICEEEGKKAEKKGSFSKQTLALYLKGLIFILQGDIPSAEAAIDELTGVVNRGLIPKHVRYINHLKGMVESKKGRFGTAIEFFKKALALLPAEAGWPTDHALFMDSLSWAYWKREDLDEAQEQFEGIIELTSGRFHYGDIYAKSFYMLGRIFEKKAMKTKAAESYRKFLDLWKNADPGIVETKDARERLADLE